MITTYTWKDLWKIGVFSIVFSIVSTFCVYGVCYTIEWLERGGLKELKEKREAKKEAKINSKYVSKTLES